MSLKDAGYVVDAARWFSDVSGLIPDLWQVNAMWSTTKRSLWNLHRQAGKSTLASGKALYKNIYHGPTTVLIVSRSLRQSKELFRKYTGLYDNCDNPPAMVEDSVTACTLSNGSRCLCLPNDEDTIRCYSGVDLIILDEASRVSDEVYYAVKPMVAVSHGEIIAMSTPAGKRGWWYKEWTEGETWERVQVRACECQRIDPAFLEEERLTNLLYPQEYDCQFLDSQGQLFSTEMIESLFSDDVEPLFGGVQ
jgi:hypothetical protein